MKYVVIIAVVILTFAAGTQVSSANSNAIVAPQTENAFAVNNYASEWLIPDSASRMIDYHHALNK